MKNENIILEKNEADVPNWIDIPDLYELTITIDEYHGFKNVEMAIFRDNDKNAPFNPKDYVPDYIPKKLLKEPSYLLLHIREHFTIDEIHKIENYFNKFSNIHVGKPYVCSIPEKDGVMPLGAIPIGGPQDICIFSSEDYPLGDLKIAGYFDLRNHEKIDPNKPADYMKILSAIDKQGKKQSIVINPDYEYLENIKTKLNS